MIREARNAKLLPQWHEYIEPQQTKDAFCYLVGLAAALKEFECYAQVKGEVRDFRFFSRGSEVEQPFAFIVDKHSLLFYFRASAVRSNRYSVESLERAFDSTAENNSGVCTVRLRTITDVQRLWSLLSIN